VSNEFSDYGQSFGPQTPPPKKSSKTPLILAIVGGIGLVCVLVCCGAGVWLVQFGMSVVSADIENQLRDHPEIDEHVGVIQKLEVDWAKSLAEDDYDIWTYDVEGTKASGELIVESESDLDSEAIVSAMLRLSTGEEIELTID
jgi:hypothetical protein